MWCARGFARLKHKFVYLFVCWGTLFTAPSEGLQRAFFFFLLLGKHIAVNQYYDTCISTWNDDCCFKKLSTALKMPQIFIWRWQSHKIRLEKISYNLVHCLLTCWTVWYIGQSGKLGLRSPRFKFPLGHGKRAWGGWGGIGKATL